MASQEARESQGARDKRLKKASFGISKSFILSVLAVRDKLVVREFLALVDWKVLLVPWGVTGLLDPLGTLE